MKTFRLSYTMTADLTVEQLWPDGDAPSEPTAEDVQARINDWPRRWPGVLFDWNLDEEEGFGHVFEVETPTT